MRAVVWAAVSSKPQLQSDSNEQQVKDGRAACEQHNWEVVATLEIPGESRDFIFFTDAEQEIEAYRQLRHLCENHAFDVLVCRGRDRLGRTDALISQVEELCKRIGKAQIYSQAMPAFIPDKPDQDRQDRGSLYAAAIERATAQAEIIELRRRHDSGMRTRVTKRGLHPNNPPYGYRKIDKKMPLVQVPEEIAVLRQIYAFYLAGWGIPRIAAWLNQNAVPPCRSREWNGASLRYMLNNTFYTGQIVHGTLVGTGQHEPVFTPHEWATLKQEQRRRQATRGKAALPYSGLVRCKVCGGAMVCCTSTRALADGTAKSYSYYRCQEGSRRLSERRTGGHNVSLPAGAIRDAVLENARQLQDPDELARACLDYALQERQEFVRVKLELEQKQAELSGEISRLLAAHTRWGSVAVGEFDQVMEDLTARREELTQALADLTIALDTLPDPEERAKRLAEYAADAEAILDSHDVEEANAWLARRIKVIRVGPCRDVTVERI